MDDLELIRRFTYRAPDDNAKRRHERIKAEALHFARVLNETCPDSRELSLAITELEQATMFANKAVATNPDPMPCTELSARWCPNCGDCTCPEDEIGNCDECDLHAPFSEHALATGIG